MKFFKHKKYTLDNLIKEMIIISYETYQMEELLTDQVVTNIALGLQYNHVKDCMNYYKLRNYHKAILETIKYLYKDYESVIETNKKYSNISKEKREAIEDLEMFLKIRDDIK